MEKVKDKDKDVGDCAKVDVLIIGAGMAGMVGADLLYRNGIRDIVVLEASNRYGGRLWTLPYGPAYIEYGANWIHGGSDQNELFHMAQQRDMLGERLEEEDRLCGLFYTSDGKSLDAELGRRCYKMFFQVEAEAGRLHHSHNLNKKRLQNKSLLQFLEEEWARVAAAAFPDESVRKDADAIFRSMVLYFRSHVGNDLSMVPATVHGTFENVKGEDVRMPWGMCALIDQYYANLPKGIVQLEVQVDGVFWQPEEQAGAKGAGQQAAEYPVRVTTVQGRTWLAKHVISTLPLGVLKRQHDKIFHPPLPPVKTKAIENIGYGKVEKIFLWFDQPFWEPGFGGVKLAWNVKDVEEKLLPRDWYKVICSFDEVFRQPNMLAAWVSGREAEIMLTLSDEEVLDTCGKILRQFTGNANMKGPDRMTRSRWLQDPHICGAYAFPIFSTSHRSFSDLAAPLPSEDEPILLFAGEATHDHYYSTLHAAYATGLREANRIVQWKQLQRKALKNHL